MGEKTIVCGILDLTVRKEGLLVKEYSNAQGYIRGETEDLYSATKQAMDKYVEKVRNEEYPLFLRNDTFRVEKAENTKEYDYWARIPVSDVRGGIWVPIKPHQEISGDMDVHDSKIVRKEYGFELHLSVSFEVSSQTPESILSVDLGERVMATTVSSADNGTPEFHGRKVREIRRHHAWLRKRLQEKGPAKKVEEMSDKEKRKVGDILHKISRKIVDRADENSSLIVIGDLKGIGNGDTGKGGRMNRIANSMPYWKLTRMMEYKAKEEGLQVVKIDEKDTSRTCHKCGSENTSRPTQGKFTCNTCGLKDYNADLNGAKNILQRFLAYTVGNGASVNKPITKVYSEKHKMGNLEKVLGSSLLTSGTS